MSTMPVGRNPAPLYVVEKKGDVEQLTSQLMESNFKIESMTSENFKMNEKLEFLGSEIFNLKSMLSNGVVRS